MAQQKKSLITRLIEGKEKSEEYARSTLPTNRWQLFWDIFKGNFGKIVKVNLLTLIFFVPLVAVILFYTMLVESNGIMLHQPLKEWFRAHRLRILLAQAPLQFLL